MPPNRPAVNCHPPATSELLLLYVLHPLKNLVNLQLSMTWESAIGNFISCHSWRHLTFLFPSSYDINYYLNSYGNTYIRTGEYEMFHLNVRGHLRGSYVGDWCAININARLLPEVEMWNVKVADGDTSQDRINYKMQRNQEYWSWQIRDKRFNWKTKKILNCF